MFGLSFFSFSCSWKAVASGLSLSHSAKKRIESLCLLKILLDDRNVGGEEQEGLSQQDRQQDQQDCLQCKFCSNVSNVSKKLILKVVFFLRIWLEIQRYWKPSWYSGNFRESKFQSTFKLRSSVNILWSLSVSRIFDISILEPNTWSYNRTLNKPSLYKVPLYKPKYTQTVLPPLRLLSVKERQMYKSGYKASTRFSSAILFLL